jgi:hypothetical protein
MAPMPTAPSIAAGPVGSAQQGGSGGGPAERAITSGTNLVIADGGLSARMGAEIMMHSCDFVDGLIVPG